LSTEPKNRTRVDRIVDVASVVLISLAAVLSAVGGFQSGKWSGHEAKLYSEAESNRVASALASATTNVRHTTDVGLFLRYIEALHSGDTAFATFLHARFLPESRAALDAWLATKPLKNPKAPLTPFVMKEYRLASEVESRHYSDLALANFRDAQEANRNSDDFLLLTVIFAGVSFMAGISTKLRFPFHMTVVALGFVALIYGVVRLAAIPFL